MIDPCRPVPQVPNRLTGGSSGSSTSEAEYVRQHGHILVHCPCDPRCTLNSNPAPRPPRTSLRLYRIQSHCDNSLPLLCTPQSLCDHLSKLAALEWDKQANSKQWPPLPLPCDSDIELYFDPTNNQSTQPVDKTSLAHRRPHGPPPQLLRRAPLSTPSSPTMSSGTLAQPGGISDPALITYVSLRRYRAAPPLATPASPCLSLDFSRCAAEEGIAGLKETSLGLV